MLVLGRKKNEAVVITGGIKITVMEIRGDRVRLGFEAPKNIQIDRDEVFQKIVSATQTPPTADELMATAGVV